MKQQENSNSIRPVTTWLLIGVIMIIIQVILGGITRLTGSGLSITEWDVITGTLPPLNEAEWMTEFAKYQATEQFRQLNSGFTLDDFKFIYFWEWFHRLWGRLIGVVFAIPFIIFLVQRRFRREMITPLIILFLLGALQGAVGWIMVASGLTGDAVYVRPAKLGMHFILALILLFYAYWFYLKLRVPPHQLMHAPRLRNFTWAVIIVLFIQLFWGALMAGHKAAVVSNTWPEMNGAFIPPGIFDRQEGMISMIEHPFVVHFIHRMLAYLLVLLVITWSIIAFRVPATPAFARSRWYPPTFVLVQTLLGIFTVVTSLDIRAYTWGIFEWMAQLHQVTGMLLVLSYVHVLYLCTGPPVTRHQPLNLN
ncbi:MAG TPA: COX15/CtaA family protein [Flavisolibacter sp.]